MKKILLATIICTVFAVGAFAQSQSIAFNDLGDGGVDANSGIYHPNDTFSVDVNLTYAGYNAWGLSFWLEVTSGLAPHLTITGITYGPQFPEGSQPVPSGTGFDTSSGATAGFLVEDRDLGSKVNDVQSDPPIPPGTYLVAHITFALSGAAPGSYTLRTTTVNPKPSIVTDENFNDQVIPLSQYSIDIVPEPSTGSWTAATPYPTDIIRYAFAQDGEDFYVISGVSSGSVVKTVRHYNATTNVWTSLADIPVGSQAPAGAFYGGRIYVADGGNSNFRIYDIATDTWSLGASRPGVSNSSGAAAGAFNDRVYIAGGAGGQSHLSIYNIATNTWSAGPALPQLYQHGGYAQIGQFLYLIGSFTGTSTNSSFSMRLNMTTNTWSTGPAWTPRRAEFALAAAGTKLFAIGGDRNGGGSSDASMLVHELETVGWPGGAWILSPDQLPSPRQGNAAGFFSTGRAGGEIWSTGGFGSANLNEHLFRPVSVPCQDYNITESTRALVPATSDTGNHCDDCMTASTAINFPFPVSFYGTVYTRARASSNGNLQFNSENASPHHTNLPAAFNATIFAFWDNLRTDLAGGGIFTSVGGIAPNRIYTIEWRVSNNTGAGTANFEIRFFEGSTDFEILYGERAGTFSGTIGVQRDSTSLFTQFAGPTAPFPAAGTRLLFTTGCCAPIAFNGAIGSNSDTYPGSSGMQTGRVLREGEASMCGALKPYPGTVDSNQRTSDRYTFINNGPATCVTFEVNSACGIHAVAYLGSFNPGNVATNYRGDPGGSLSPFRHFSVDVPANGTVVLVVNELGAGVGCASYDVVVRGLNCPLELVSAASRKTHGKAGEFNIPLPLAGQPGIECRTGGAGGNHRLVFTFNTEVTSGNATVIAGVGSAGPATFLGKTMTVPLSGVTDMQKITVRLSGVTDTFSRVLPNTPVGMNVLLGDTTGNKTVNASDIGQTKSKSGQTTDAANFRNDTTVSGSINASDIGQVKANSGHAVP